MWDLRNLIIGGIRETVVQNINKTFSVWKETRPVEFLESEGQNEEVLWIRCSRALWTKDAKITPFN